MSPARRTLLREAPQPRDARLPDPLGAERPPIDPRFRERRISARRRAVRRRLLILGILAGACTLGIGGVALLHSSLLAVRTVQVTGIAHTSRARVLSAAHLSKIMIDVNGPRAAKRVEALPWVAGAKVERHWPSRVRISVVERKPVAEVPLSGTGAGPTRPGGGPEGPAPAPGSSWALVDGSSRVLADVGQLSPALVVLGGMGDPGPPGSQLGSGAGPAIEVVVRLLPSLAPRVAAVNAVGGGDLDLVLRLSGPAGPISPASGGPRWTAGQPVKPMPTALATGPTVVLGGPDQLGAKLQALAVLVGQVDLSGVHSIDLRVPQAPALSRG